jgi:hypothetical protein
MQMLPASTGTVPASYGESPSLAVLLSDAQYALNRYQELDNAVVCNQWRAPKRTKEDCARVQRAIGEALLAVPAFIRGLMGPFGSGKSSGCVIELVKLSKRQPLVNGKRRARFACIRNTYGQLARYNYQDLPSLAARPGFRHVQQGRSHLPFEPAGRPRRRDTFPRARIASWPS